MPEIIEMGTVSSRGQIAIPNSIRKEMKLEDGNKVVFLLSEDSLMMKKVSIETFSEITKPLREIKKKIDESQVTSLVHKLRKVNK